MITWRNGVVAAAVLLQPGAKVLEGGERAIGQVGPVAPFLVEGIGREKVGGVASGIDRLHRAPLSDHYRARRAQARGPSRQREADRLSQMIDVLGHCPPVIP